MAAPPAPAPAPARGARAAAARAAQAAVDADDFVVAVCCVYDFFPEATALAAVHALVRGWAEGAAGAAGAGGAGWRRGAVAPGDIGGLVAAFDDARVAALRARVAEELEEDASRAQLKDWCAEHDVALKGAVEEFVEDVVRVAFAAELKAEADAKAAARKAIATLKADEAAKAALLSCRVVHFALPAAGAAGAGGWAEEALAELRAYHPKVVELGAGAPEGLLMPGLLQRGRFLEVYAPPSLPAPAAPLWRAWASNTAVAMLAHLDAQLLHFYLLKTLVAAKAGPFMTLFQQSFVNEPAGRHAWRALLDKLGAPAGEDYDAVLRALLGHFWRRLEAEAAAAAADAADAGEAGGAGAGEAGGAGAGGGGGGGGGGAGAGAGGGAGGDAAAAAGARHRTVEATSITAAGAAASYLSKLSVRALGRVVLQDVEEE